MPRGYRSRRAYKAKRAAAKMYKRSYKPLYRSIRAHKVLAHKFSRMLPDYHLYNAGSQVVKWADTNGNSINVPTGWNYVGSTPGMNGTTKFGISYLSQFLQILDTSDFTSLFDRYRITGVKLTIIPMNNTARANSLDSIGTCSYVVDYDDNDVAGNENDILVKEGSKTKRLDKPFSIYYKPKTLSGVVDVDGNVVGSAIARPQWLNMENPAVNHYGLKMFFNDVNVGAQQTSNMLIKLRTKLYFSCKDTQ